MNTPITCARCQKGDRLALHPGSGNNFREVYCERCGKHSHWLRRRDYGQALDQGIKEVIQHDLFGGAL